MQALAVTMLGGEISAQSITVRVRRRGRPGRRDGRRRPLGDHRARRPRPAGHAEREHPAAARRLGHARRPRRVELDLGRAALGGELRHGPSHPDQRRARRPSRRERRSSSGRRRPAAVAQAAPTSTPAKPPKPASVRTGGHEPGSPDGGPPRRPAAERSAASPAARSPGAPPELVRAVPEASRPAHARAATCSRSSGRRRSATRSARSARDVAGKWHHGEDLVAPRGTPLLAVADGTLFSVGWNDIGGWRLWLRDDGGNEFYYAHLDAYSPLAVAGRRVKAGDVLGFVGTSGDAEGGLPHLHFEIHPVEFLSLGYDGAVAPYPFLIALAARGGRVVRVRASVPRHRRGTACRSRRPAQAPCSSTRATSRARAGSCPARCSGRSPAARPAPTRIRSDAP